MTPMRERPSWDVYFMDIARTAATRSTCLRRHEICRGSHAEQNLLVQAARYGTGVAGATLYRTNEPCSICTKLLISAGIVQIVYEAAYPDPLARELRDEAGLPTIHLDRDDLDRPR